MRDRRGLALERDVDDTHILPERARELRRRREAEELRRRKAEDRKPPRSAHDLMMAMGDLDMPPDTPPSPALVRECRKALGMTQKELSWRLGAHSRQSTTIVRCAELGQRPLNRAQRLLLYELLLRLQKAEQSQWFDNR